MTAQELIDEVLRPNTEKEQTIPMDAGMRADRLADAAPKLAWMLKVAMDYIQCTPCQCSDDRMYRCPACIDLTELDRIAQEGE